MNLINRSLALFSLLSVFTLVHPGLYAQDINKTLSFGGRERNYILHLPPGWQINRSYPVLFAFHGGGGTARQSARFYHLDELADQHGFIVVYPDAINKAWNIPGLTSRAPHLDTTVDDRGFISLLMDTLVASYAADPHQFFLTGISRGGMFSFYLASALNERVAGIAPVCAGISRTLALTYHFNKPVPVLMINGTGDPLIRYEGGYGSFNQKNLGNEDADLLPAEELLELIAKQNHCSGEPQSRAIPNTVRYDGCTALAYSYPCEGAHLQFIKVINGGHTWPGGSQYLPKAIVGKVCRDFKAEEKIFSFFLGLSGKETVAILPK